MTSNSAHQIRRSLLASVATIASIVIANPAAAQAPGPAPGPAPATATVDSDQIVITGTRRTDRTVTNSASPIDVISSAELTTQPTANLLDTVKNIVPSFYVGQNSISDASSFVRAPSLRGLSADEVLVQINGKRFNRSALVQVYVGGDTALSFGSQGADISAIPSIAIKNLQVLRDGATAQYGSDAIAGVMNFGLRNDRQGVELQARYGQYFDHGSRKLDDGTSRQIAGAAESASAQPASSTSPASISTTMAPAAGKPGRSLSSSPSRIRRSPTNCPIIRCRCRSGAARRNMAGRRC